MVGEWFFAITRLSGSFGQLLFWFLGGLGGQGGVGRATTDGASQREAQPPHEVHHSAGLLHSWGWSGLRRVRGSVVESGRGLCTLHANLLFHFRFCCLSLQSPAPHQVS